MLAPTPADRLCDAQGRPYFLWDVSLTLDELRVKLLDPAEGDYWLATVLRQAKPDDAIVLLGLPTIAAAWERVAPGVGNARAFWEWRVHAGLQVDRLQTGASFVRLRVSNAAESLPVDLVADPVPVVEAPVPLAPGLLIDTPHEILVNKLTALLSRWAVRDLVDVRALVDSGADLERALADAPKKDAGFSPQTLAWVLETTPAPLSPEDQAFKEALVRRLLT